MKKGYIVFSVIATILFAGFLMWYNEYPGNANFYCSKAQNICKATYKNIFGYEFTQSVLLNTVHSAALEERLRRKKNYGRYSTGYHDCYNYYFYLNYNNNGKYDVFPVYKSTDYDYAPADESIEREIAYYNEGVRDFNIFLKEDKLTIYELRDYVSRFAKSDYWTDLIYIILMGSIFLFVLIIPVILIALDSIATYVPFLKPFEKFSKKVFKD